MSADIYTDMCIDMCTDACTDVCSDMCIDVAALPCRGVFEGYGGDFFFFFFHAAESSRGMAATLKPFDTAFIVMTYIVMATRSAALLHGTAAGPF